LSDGAEGRRWLWDVLRQYSPLMPRTKIKHHLPLSPAWLSLAREAWRRSKERGALKAGVVERTGKARSTAGRILSGSDAVSFDSLEALRLALNGEVPDAALPPAVAPVRSATHYAWCERGADYDEEGVLDDRMLEWADLGARCARAGVLDEASRLLARLVDGKDGTRTDGGRSFGITVELPGPAFGHGAKHADPIEGVPPPRPPSSRPPRTRKGH
jgi:hypothetical protein